MSAPRMRWVALGLAVLALAGCGADNSSITFGGRVGGDTLTVYSVLPRTGPRAETARDIVLGQKLALAQAGGRAGAFAISFASVELPRDRGRRAQAAAVREVIRDPAISAVIGDLTWDTARVSVPLYNAAGILHVSPGATYTGFVAPVEGDPGSPERYAPSGRASFAPWLPTDAALAVAMARAARGDVAVETTAGQPDEALAAAVRERLDRTVDTARADTIVLSASDPEDALGIVRGMLAENRRARILLPGGLWRTDLPARLAGEPRVRFVTAAAPPDPAFAEAFEETFGRRPGPEAQIGYDAMRAVLDAVGRAGRRAGVRQVLIESYFDADPLRDAAVRPFFLASRDRGGEARYEPVP